MTAEKEIEKETQQNLVRTQQEDRLQIATNEANGKRGTTLTRRKKSFSISFTLNNLFCDIVILTKSSEHSKAILTEIEKYCHEKLKISLNNRTVINKVSSGINFTGYIHYGNKTLIRSKTYKKIERKFVEKDEAAIRSCIGVFKHGNNFNKFKRLLIKYNRLDLLKYM